MILETNVADLVDIHGTQLLNTALHTKECSVLCRVQGASTNLVVGSLGTMSAKSYCVDNIVGCCSIACYECKT